MTCFQIIKAVLYFSSFVCLLANPVSDTIGAMSALFAAIVVTLFLVTRFIYRKNYKLKINESDTQLVIEEEQNKKKVTGPNKCGLITFWIILVIQTLLVILLAS